MYKYLVDVCLSMAILFHFLCVQHTSANEDMYRYVASKLSNFRVEHGFAPDYEDFFEIVLQPEYRFSLEDLAKLSDIVINMQKSNVSKDQLLTLIKAKRDSIKDFRINYKVFSNLTNPFTYSRENREVNYVSASKGSMQYLSTQVLGRPARVQFFDGENIFSRHIVSEGIPTVDITPFSSFNVFLEARSPLVSSMLLDSKKLFGQSDYLYDVVSVLELPETTVFEKTEVVNDIECIVVASLGIKVFLSPKHDFSIIQVMDYRHHLERGDGGEPLLSGVSISEKRTLLDLKDCGNGIWLPYRSESVFYSREGEVTGEVVALVSLIEINNGIEDSFFTDFIPQDAVVLDTVRDMVYEWTEYPSIEGILKSTVKSKRVWTFQIISVTLGLLMIIVALVMKYLAYRRRVYAE